MVSAIEIPDGSLFGLDNLPYGIFTVGGASPRAGVRVADSVIDLAAALRDEVFTAPALNPFMAEGPARWAAARVRIIELITAADVPARAIHPLREVEVRLPFEVADYVDFYASEHHASNVGRLFRPGAEPLTPNWKHLPIGYHGRSGTVVVSDSWFGANYAPDGWDPSQKWVYLLTEAVPVLFFALMGVLFWWLGRPTRSEVVKLETIPVEAAD